MISQAYIREWEQHAPWQFDDQIEQDLLLSRMLIEIYNDPELKELLLFRGGTALSKLYFNSAWRYSEDLDFVQLNAGSIKPIVERIQALLDPWMGKSTTQPRANGSRIYYRFQPESGGTIPRRIKIEINTREHFTVFGKVEKEYSMITRWFSGTAPIQTYCLNELAGTKLRALYQRKKGRDLFDLYKILAGKMIESGRTIQAFQVYLDNQDLHVTKDQFLMNLRIKMADRSFRTDIEPLLVPGTKYNAEEAFESVQKLIQNLSD